jgi:hypothetical protein
MIEFHQLLRMYIMTYPQKKAETEIIISDIEERYRKVTGEEIREAKNPRNAGRKRRYTEEMDRRIVELRKQEYSLRRIAREEKCSLGRVQDVLKKHGVC